MRLPIVNKAGLLVSLSSVLVGYYDPDYGSSK